MHLLTRILLPEVPDREVTWMLPEPDSTQKQREASLALHTEHLPIAQVQKSCLTAEQDISRENKIHRRAGMQLFAPM